MAKFSFKNATCLYGPLDISGNTNQVTLEAMAAELSTSNFAGNGWKEITNGLLSGNASYSGYLETTGEPDAYFFNNTVGIPATFTKTNPAVAEDVAYALKVARTRYSPKMPVGELYGFDLSTAGQSPLVRGIILAAEDAVTATDVTAAVNHGAIAAGQYAYAAIHVTAVTGTTVEFDAIIESDTQEDFLDDPTTRFTFTQVTDVTGVSSQWATPLAGAIADHDWWRVSYTITGTAAFTYRVFFGIQ